MLKINTVQTNFTSGELSPWLLGRSDIDRYANGAEILENFSARHQGGIVRRRGTRNVCRTYAQGSSANVRIQEFAFSRNDAVLVQISAGRFRFARRRRPACGRQLEPNPSYSGLWHVHGGALRG